VLLHPRKQVPKTYVVQVSGVMKPRDLEIWRRGVRLDDGTTLPAEIELLRYEGDTTWIELTIFEGRDRQIRRMGEATGFPVLRLARESFAGIELEGLPAGRWRAMTQRELRSLEKAYGVPRSPPREPAPTREDRGARPRTRGTPSPHANKDPRARRSLALTRAARTGRLPSAYHPARCSPAVRSLHHRASRTSDVASRIA
jgi:23S rRNA pseudouridine2605 synthase